MKRYRLVCKISFANVLLQLIVWALFIIISFGIVTPFFIYYLIKKVINNTEMHEIEETPIYPPKE